MFFRHCHADRDGVLFVEVDRSRVIAVGENSRFERRRQGGTLRMALTRHRSSMSDSSPLVGLIPDVAQRGSCRMPAFLGSPGQRVNAIAETSPINS